MISPLKVSIVLPTYNGAKYIKRSIDSCLNQTYKNIELIIVDDGSTDETSLIIKSYTDKRVKYIRHRKNMGLPAALNTGLTKTEGKYLTWTSDDNQFMPTAIEEMTNFLERQTNVDLVYADYWAHYLETGGKELRIMPDELNLESNNCVGACFLFTRRAYEAVGEYDTRYRLVEDYDYWIRIWKRFGTKHYPKPLYIYGEHSKSLKSTKQINILLLEAILKYKNGFISFVELRDFIAGSFYAVDEILLPKKFLNILQGIIRISRVSFRLCVLSLVLLLHFSGKKILAIFSSVLVLPAEYMDFFLLFKPKLSHLRPTPGRKNVLFIIPYLVAGGAEKVVLNIARGVDTEKFSFHLITTTPANNIWRSKFEKYFQNVITPLNRVKKLFSYNKIDYRYFKYLIEKLNINIILITNSEVGYQYLPRLKLDFGSIKIIDVLHSEKHPPIQKVESATVYIDRRICISEHLKNFLINRFVVLKNGKYLKRLIVIHNGVDVGEYQAKAISKGKFRSRFSIPENAKVITFIGRFTGEKNPLLFIEIAKILTQSMQDVRFVMAGDGPDFNKVNSTIRNYGLEKYITLTGMIENSYDLLNDTYILLIVSKTEGIPLVALEAMSMGVPVISTDTGAIGEVVEDGTNGFLVNPENNVSEIIKDFTGKILDLLNGQINYYALSEKARETIIPRFTLESMTKSYENLFYQLVDSHFEKNLIEATIEN